MKVHNLLRQIARNHLLDQPAPSIPKNFGPSLKQEIAQGGGLLEWARARPDYELVENVMLNNLLRNEPSKFRDAHRSELSKIRRPIVFDGAEPTDAYRSHIETLRDELIEIEAALSDFKSQLELEHRQLFRLKIQIQIDHHQQMVEAIEKEILRWSQKIGQVARHCQRKFS